MPLMNFDLEDGKPPVSFALKPADAERFEAFMAECDAALKNVAAPTAPFQHRVQPWMMECFGPTIAADTQERNHRFLEEALELVQACGASQSEAHQLVDYVYGRPVGDPFQEVGGVMVTLAALCLVQQIDMHIAGEVELSRIWTKVKQIRAKQAAKPKHSPLPAAPETRKDFPSLSMPAINDREMAMFNRFCEICEDFEAGGYDVPKEMMNRLACIGLVRSCGFGRYETTEFGDTVRTLIGGEK